MCHILLSWEDVQPLSCLNDWPKSKGNRHSESVGSSLEGSVHGLGWSSAEGHRLDGDGLDGV